MLIKINIFFLLWGKLCRKILFLFILQGIFFFEEIFFFFSVVFFTFRIYFFFGLGKIDFLVLCKGVCAFFSLTFLLCIYFFGHLFRCWKGCINFKGFLHLFFINGNLYTVLLYKFIWVPDSRLVKLIKYYIW